MWSFIAGMIVAGLLLGVWRCYGVKPHTERRGESERRTGQEFQELAQLTGELAHEIKNPLSTLKLNLRLVQEQLDETQEPIPQVRRALNKLVIIQEEADRLDKLLTGFLGYVRPPDCQWRTIDLSEVVGEVVDFYQPQAQEHHITLRHSFASEPLHVRLDVAMFKQALLNLFINSQQAMPKGGELLVSTHDEGTQARVQISDTGCGIPTNALPRLFTPYFSTRRKGTGLGLATVKRIVTLFAGDIAVASELDKGTSFTLRLPRQPEAAPLQEVRR